jgi:hypothetical protein
MSALLIVVPSVFALGLSHDPGRGALHPQFKLAVMRQWSYFQTVQSTQVTPCKAKYPAKFSFVR